MSRISGGMIGARNLRIINQGLAEAHSAQQSTGLAQGTNVGGVGVTHAPGGLIVDQDSFRAVIQNVPVVIVAEGPNGETYDDCRYWAREIYTKKTDFDEGGPVEIWIKGSGFWAPIYNVNETAAGTHELHEFDAGTDKDDVQVDDASAVIVLAQLGDGIATDPTASEYVFSVYGGGGGSGKVISGKVTGNAAGNGKYTGKSFTTRTTDVPASGNLAESDFGTLAGSNDCLILNPVELGSSTTGHDVTATVNTDHFAIYFTGRWASTNSDGTKVVHAMLFFAGCE